MQQGRPQTQQSRRCGCGRAGCKHCVSGADDRLGARRRALLQLGGAGAITALLPACAAGPQQPGGSTRLGFAPVAPVAAGASADDLRLPKGYLASVVASSGEPIGVVGRVPASKADGGSRAVEQALQFGPQHAGVQFHPQGGGRGLLLINHTDADDGLQQQPGTAVTPADIVRAAQAAQGISVCEVVQKSGPWQLLRPSKYARRLTAGTPMAVAGPAAGHLLMRTAADPEGRNVLGTVGNRGGARTPWGTFLSSEAGWAGCFGGGAGATADQRRYGLGRDPAGRWPEHDQRFDARRHPNEFHRFGWVVEVDPLDPASPAVKRTALGRAAHGGCCVTLTKDGRAVVYGADAAPFEPVWKFVSQGRMAPPGGGRSAAQANSTLLDSGTLYVARFDADGSGQWLPLLHGLGALLPARGFADQAEVLIKARQAGDAVGASRMARPAWTAVAANGDVVCALAGSPASAAALQNGIDAANARADGPVGGVVRWREAGDADATSFAWSRLPLAGGPAHDAAEPRAEAASGVHAAAFDGRGVLWLQTTAAAAVPSGGQQAPVVNSDMLACDLASGDVRRFLAGPANGAITGIAWAPDGRTLFASVQRPAAWPGRAGQPRSATIAVRRSDGGIIGA